MKDRLILTGSPGNASTFDEETGTLSVRIAPDPRTMGRMFIEGLRRATWCGRRRSLGNPAGACKKQPYRCSNLNDLRRRSTLQRYSTVPHWGKTAAGLRLYHHSQCFESVETESPQRRARVMEQHLETWEPSSPIASQTLRIEENIKGAAHHLDATFSCPRRYWLEHVRVGRRNLSCCPTRPLNPQPHDGGPCPQRLD